MKMMKVRYAQLSFTAATFRLLLFRRFYILLIECKTLFWDRFASIERASLAAGFGAHTSGRCTYCLYFLLEYPSHKLAEALYNIVASFGRHAKGCNEAILLCKLVEKGLSHVLFQLFLAKV